MSNSYLLSSSPVGKVCSDPALLFITHYFYYFVLTMLDLKVEGVLKVCVVFWHCGGIKKLYCF